MNKIILVASVLALGVGSAMAGPAFGDGSPANSSIAGQQHVGAAQNTVKDPQNFYRGDGSVEDNYYPGRRVNAPISRTGVSKKEMNNFGDGSPANQDS